MIGNWLIVFGCACVLVCPATALAWGVERESTDTAEAFITGFILRDALNDHDVRIRLTSVQSDGVPIDPNVPFAFNHGISLHVRQETNEGLADFEALLYPDDGEDALVEGEVRSSLARIFLKAGWAILGGDLPVVDSDWGEAGAEGTDMAVRIIDDEDPAKRKIVVYNLETSGSKTVTVDLDSQVNDITLDPNEYVEAVQQPQTQPQPQTIPTGDTFVAMARQKAKDARIGRATTLTGGD